MKRYVSYAFFPVMFMYLEIIYRIFTKRTLLTLNIIYPILTAVTLGLFVFLLTSSFSKKVNKILGYSILSLVCLLFCINLVYNNVCKTSFTMALVFGGTGGAKAVTEFAGETIQGIKDSIVGVLCLLLPIPVTILTDIFWLPIFGRLKRIRKIGFAVAVVTVHMFAMILVFLNANGINSAKSLYFDSFFVDKSTDKFGILTTTKLDLKAVIFGVKEIYDEVDREQVIPDLANNKKNNSENDSETPSGENVEVTVPVTYEPNVINIDFDAFTAGENSQSVVWLNEFFAASEPTMKNKYTGMFEGYNLILITAESFSPWAVSEKYTPTLYKLVNTGFVFNNYYVPAYNNTTMGEYMVCTGLLPNGLGDICFNKTVSGTKKYMGMCFGNILKERGYSTNAYHNHAYDYYNRDETHPNMGYTYKGVGNGLNITNVWPESDLEMMEQTVGEYINNEQFHAYYMTVSGHLNYTFIGNSMSYKNKALVEDMNDTETMKAYMACNIELDRALEYLIKQLEEKGVADKTVIAMACDHYPYAMEDELTEKIGAEKAKWYGLYENNLVIWSASMKEPVYVDKVCSSIDIVPTLLNLMGIEYDSRLYSGKDILSDTPGLVIFSDMGFATDYCIYNGTTGEVKQTADVEVPDEYIDTLNALVKNIWNASGRLIDVDYYRLMQKYIK